MVPGERFAIGSEFPHRGGGKGEGERAIINVNVLQAVTEKARTALKPARRAAGARAKADRVVAGRAALMQRAMEAIVNGGGTGKRAAP